MFKLVSNVIRKICIFRLLAIVAIVGVCSSCVGVEMEDVSGDPKYSKIIGKRFKLKKDLWATGITLDPNYGKKIDYYVLVPGVGFTGPEVVHRFLLKSGTIIEIVGVYKTTSTLSKRIIYLVKEIGTNQIEGKEIRIKAKGHSNNYGLDEDIYEEVVLYNEGK